jgi:ABC-2 type transport system ATP-binding protein
MLTHTQQPTTPDPDGPPQHLGTTVTTRRTTASAAPAIEPSIAVRDLRCSYGSNEALRGIDLDVRRGEIFALLGPNGAGKTTTVEILEGFRARGGGEVRVLGADPADAPAGWRGRVGVVLQESTPEPELTVRECLELYAGYYGRPRDVAETLELVGLARLAERRCELLSGGERRRLDVALALVGDPELIFLDEPTTGFDPAARRAAWDLVLGLRELGKTILLTTHYMEEAERLADRIAVLVQGRIVATGTPRSLGARERMDARVSFTLPEGTDWRELPAAVDAEPPDASGVVCARTREPAATLLALTGWAVGRELTLPDLEVRRPSLEDVYLELTANDNQEAHR